MKKFLRLFSFLIAFFLGGIFFSLNVKAEAVPQLSSSTFTLIEGGNNALWSSGFSSQSLFPFPNSAENINNVIAIASGNPLIDGATLKSVSYNQYDVRSLTNDEISNNSVIYPYLYDVSGNIVNWDNVYFVHYDNGYCHGELYVDGDGNILTADSSNTYSMFKLGYGGYSLGVTDIANIYSDIADQLTLDNMNFSLNSDIDVSNVYTTCFYYLAYKDRFGTRLTRVFVPNVYSNSNFTMNGNYDLMFNGNNNYVTVLTGDGLVDTNVMSSSNNYVYNGVTYENRFYIGSSWIQQATFVDSLSDITSNGRYVVASNGFVYDSSKATNYNSNNVVSFKVIDPTNANKLIQIDNDSYDYNSIKELEQSLNNVQPTTNTNYNPQNNIDELNYPVNYPVSNNELQPSDLPFPNPSPNPNPNPFPDSDPETDPVISNPYNPIDPTAITNNIPFITGLQNKFPFSIPWDIYNLVNGLSVPRETPVLEYEIEFPIINYTWEISIDLSMYDNTATLFRTLFLITFIIGLAVFSYNHFFGT